MRFFYLRASDTDSIILVFNLSNQPLFSVGVQFVLCVASPRKNISRAPSFGGCGFIYALFGSKLCFLVRENSW